MNKVPVELAQLLVRQLGFDEVSIAARKGVMIEVVEWPAPSNIVIDQQGHVVRNANLSNAMRAVN